MKRTALSLTLCTAVLAVPALFLSSLQAQVAPAIRRITTAINDADRVALTNGVRPQLKRSADLGAVDGATPAEHLLMVLARSDQRQQALMQYLSNVQDPASSSYHKWLTSAQFGTMFGASADDIAALSAWLEAQGFTVEKVPDAANVIQFSGDVSQVERAFSTQIHAVNVNGVQHRANITAPQLPRALATAVTSIVGLDDFHPQSLVQKGPSATFDPSTKKIQPEFTLFSTSGTPYLYMNPADAATIYNVPNTTLNPNYSGTSYDGTGVTVGVVGDSNVDLTKVNLYREDFLNEAAGNVNLPTVIIDGADPGINGDEVETFLDLEILGGVAPKATINYYASDDTDISPGLFNAIERAIDDNTVSVLSISFGECEANAGSTTAQFLSAEFEQAAAQGITVVVSSGDAGSAGCDSSAATAAVNGLGINALSSTPYNISVGGTDYDVLSTNFSNYVQDSLNGQEYSGSAPYWRTALKYIPEEPWNDSTSTNGALADNAPYLGGGASNIIGGGGGSSIYFSKPSFQTLLTPADDKRDVPDVSFMAGNGLHGAVWLVCGTGTNDCVTSNGNFTSSTTFSGAGGTSAATPAFAGMLALVVQATGTRLGQANNVLYQLAASKYGTVFHDVTIGNNSVVCTSGTADCGTNGFTNGFDAAAGYDLASGLGSVDAVAMLANWGSATIGETTTALQIDGSTNAVSVTHGTSLNFGVTVTPATATGSAALVTTQAANTGDPTNNGQKVIALANGTGSLSYNGLPGGSYTVYARYSGDTAEASSSSTPIDVTISAEPSSTLLSINAYTSTGNSITSLSTVPYGSYLYADASVYGTAEGYEASLGLATGTFTYLDGSTAIGTAPMNSSNYASFPQASGSIYPYAVGTHRLTASYPGDASYKSNTSNEVAFTVVKGTTKAYVFPNTASMTSSARDIVQVDIETSSFGSAPTGTITLSANGTTLGSSSNFITGTMSDGTALSYVNFNVQGTQLVSGLNTLTTSYSGDSNYQGSTATSAVTVQQASFTLRAGTVRTTAGSTTGSTTTITASPVNGFAGLVNLNCAVTDAPSDAVSPISCSVPATFNITGTASATGTLTIGSTAATTGGTYTVTISGADTATGKITASTTTQVTIAGVPSIVLTGGGNISISAGATSGNTSTLNVTPTGGYTGVVTLLCALTTAPAGAIDPVTCALSPSSVSITGAAAAISTLTINSTARTTQTLNRPNGVLGAASGTVLTLGILFLAPALKRRALYGLVVLASLVSIGSLAGCGGGSKSTSTGGSSTTGTTAGAYVITVTASAAGAGSQTSTVNVTVN